MPVMPRRSRALLARALLAPLAVLLAGLVPPSSPARAQDSHRIPVIIDGRDISEWVYKDPPLDVAPTRIPDLREPVREILNTLAEYAHKRDPEFKILVRGGEMLATQTARDQAVAEITAPPGAPATLIEQLPLGAPHRRFVRNIAGVVMDQRYCPPITNTLESAGLGRLQALDLKVFTLERCPDDKTAADAVLHAGTEGVLAATTTDALHPFGRVSLARPVGETLDSVRTFSKVRTLLVALDPHGYERMNDWLKALALTNHDLLIVDPFFNGNEALTKEQVDHLKLKALGGRRFVIARLTLGLAQDTLPYWKPEWRVGNPAWITGYFPGISGTYWVDMTNPEWLALMGKGFASLMDLGFDGIMFDGVTTFLRAEALMPI
ncbi:alpha-1,4-polygalactosaminidase [Pararhodospirillum oryzae]|uniref:Alpha-1,4-polygalactosaminidase n=1 Tax=Pararhodospirillum oryzae TaxID=478448 RepID=A0A512H7P7_9PROT|nr:alpha-1,4-polygalactosaminidase [Pararhodospirillum oryzae]GEO81476.1 alpha-1,4-polygalactosaminidase [Pararhodospirillum oryzae]